jgi:hypothetical protein
VTDTYRPRRASSRWLDGDCPDGVLAIFDDGPRTLDRYTIFYREVIDGDRGPWLGYLGTSDNPQGFGGHGEMEAHQVRAYRYRNGHRACRWTDLPQAVRDTVRADLGLCPSYALGGAMRCALPEGHEGDHVTATGGRWKNRRN